MSLSTDNLLVFFLLCPQEYNQSFTSLFFGRPIRGGLGHQGLSKRNREQSRVGCFFFLFFFLTVGRAGAVRHVHCHLLSPLCRNRTAGRSRVTPGNLSSSVTEYVYSSAVFRYCSFHFTLPLCYMFEANTVLLLCYICFITSVTSYFSDHMLLQSQSSTFLN